MNSLIKTCGCDKSLKKWVSHLKMNSLLLKSGVSQSVRKRNTTLFRSRHELKQMSHAMLVTTLTVFDHARLAKGSGDGD